MRSRIALAVVVSSLAVPLGIAAQEIEGTRPACVTVRSEPRAQAYGWNHVVSVRNGCAAEITCRIHTDVNPTPIALTIPARETRETVTFRDSPVSAFRPVVDCEQR